MHDGNKLYFIIYLKIHEQQGKGEFKQEDDWRWKTPELFRRNRDRY